MECSTHEHIVWHVHREIIDSMEDIMYNPIKEEFMLAQLFERITATNASEQLRV